MPDPRPKRERVSLRDRAHRPGGGAVPAEVRPARLADEGLRWLALTLLVRSLSNLRCLRLLLVLALILAFAFVAHGDAFLRLGNALGPTK